MQTTAAQRELLKQKIAFNCCLYLEELARAANLAPKVQLDWSEPQARAPTWLLETA